MDKSIDQTLLQFAYDTGLFTLMNTKWAWPIVESLHFVGLCLLIGTVGTYDLRMLGIGKGLPISALHRLIPYGVAGYCLNLITGSMFFLAAPAQYLYNPAFQLKALFMACAGVNMIIFYATTNRAVKQTPEFVSVIRRAKIMALVSLLSWVGVITCGRLLTFFRPPYHWCVWC